jgi:long-chain acyl-CoA synthetase
MEKENIRLTFPAMFNETLRKFGKNNVWSFAGEEPKSYETANKDIQALIALLEKNGVCPGDKVALLSSNMPNWGVAFFAITFMGAIVVPILPDFSLFLLHYCQESKVINLMFLKPGLSLKIFPFFSLIKIPLITMLQLFPQKNMMWQKKILRLLFILQELLVGQRVLC